jgi:hypothetical protein
MLAQILWRAMLFLVLTFGYAGLTALPYLV